MTELWRRVRSGCVLACLAVSPLVGWRGLQVGAEVRQDRRAAAAYAQGVRAQLAGQYADAAEAFTRAAALSPRATGALAALGEVELRRGRYDAAVAAYRRLMARYPYAYLAELHRQVGLIELRADRPREAERALREAVALDPGDWLAFYWLGHALARQGRRREARAMWQHTVRLNPGFAPAQRRLQP